MSSLKRDHQPAPDNHNIGLNMSIFKVLLTSTAFHSLKLVGYLDYYSIFSVRISRREPDCVLWGKMLM